MTLREALFQLLQGSTHIAGILMENAQQVIPADNNWLDLGVVKRFGHPGATFTGGLKRPPPDMTPRVLPGNFAFGISGQHPHFKGVRHPITPHPDVKCVTLGQIFGADHFCRKAPATVEFVMAVRICGKLPELERLSTNACPVTNSKRPSVNFVDIIGRMRMFTHIPQTTPAFACLTTNTLLPRCIYVRGDGHSRTTPIRPRNLEAPSMVAYRNSRRLSRVPGPHSRSDCVCTHRRCRSQSRALCGRHYGDVHRVFGWTSRDDLGRHRRYGPGRGTCGRIARCPIPVCHRHSGGSAADPAGAHWRSETHEVHSTIGHDGICECVSHPDLCRTTA